MSFLPLWLSVIFIDINYIWTKGLNESLFELECAIIIGILLIISIVVVFIKFKHRGHENAFIYEICEAKEKKMITVDFILSYVVPLMAFDFTDLKGIMLFLIFFVTFGYLIVKHNIFNANILLELFNFSYYECTLTTKDCKSGVPTTIISRRPLNSMLGETISVRSLSNELKFDISVK